MNAIARWLSMIHDYQIKHGESPREIWVDAQFEHELFDECQKMTIGFSSPVPPNIEMPRERLRLYGVEVRIIHIAN